MRNKYRDLAFRPISSLWYMFHLSFFGPVIEVAKFEDEFFLGVENVTPKKEIN
jgi:hypothetical protein